MVPVSKNFLKKTLIKNEAAKKANKELLNICKQALAKQAEKFKIIDINRQKEIDEYNKNLKDELYEKTQKINLLKMLNEKKKHDIEKKIKLENIKKMHINEKLNSNVKYIELQNQHEIIKKIIYEPINKKKELLSLYRDIPDENLNIDIYNIMIN
jgi:hypothetical protein